MGALDRLRAANGDGGFLGRVREDGRLLVAIAAGAILVLAWIGWAIYVTSSDGARAGLGVVVAWPAMLAALAIISLPFIGIFLLIRYLAGGGAPDDVDDAGGEAENPEDESEEDPDEDDEGDSDEDEGESEEDPDEDDEGDSDEDEGGSEDDEESEDEPESEASKAG